MPKKKAKPKDECLTSVQDMGPSTELMDLFDSLDAEQQKFWYEYWMGGCINRIKAGKFAGWKNPLVSSYAAIHSATGRRLMGLYLDEFGITGTSLMAELHRINNASMADYEGLFHGESLVDLQDKGVDTRQIKKFRITVKEHKGIHPYTETSTAIQLYSRFSAIETMAKIRKLYDDDDDGKKKIGVEAVIDLLDAQEERIITRPENVEKALNGGVDADAGA